MLITQLFTTVLGKQLIIKPLENHESPKPKFHKYELTL